MASNRRIVRHGLVAILAATAPGQAQSTLYDIGHVSAQEQFYIELINRARAEPAAEGTRLAALGTSDPEIAFAYEYFGVNLARMQQEMAALAPAAPLAPNSRLRKAALGHARDMAAGAHQSHTGSDGSTIAQRLARAGYNFRTAGENNAIQTYHPVHGHAGFEVEWGGDRWGMLAGRAHRVNIHNAALKEIGVGLVTIDRETAERTGTGPQVASQLLGTDNTGRPFVTGVTFFDLDGDRFYTPGEGIGGVQVTVKGNAFRAVTASGGGYAIPLPGNGNYELTFAAAGMDKVPPRTVTVKNGANVKADLRLAYAPRVAGPSGPVVGRASTYTSDPVAGATSYRLRAARLRPAEQLWRVEIDADPYVVGPFPGMGKNDELMLAYNLSHGRVAMPRRPGAPNAETIRLTPTFVPSKSARLVFRSRLARATPGQSALVEVVSDGQTTVVFRQAGKGFTGERGFRTVSVDLSAFANKEISVRFRYVAAWDQDFYAHERRDVLPTGWFFDWIELRGTWEVVSERALDAVPPTRSVQFTPNSAGLWWLRAQAKVSGQFVRVGPGRMVRATSP
jgi:hypothetical protein